MALSLPKFLRRSRKKKNLLLIAGGFAVMTIGIFGLFLPFISFPQSEDYALLKELAAKPELLDLQPADTGNVPAFDPNRPGIPDRLVIPSAGIDMPLLGGADPDVLLKGGWVFPRSVAPNPNSGNTVIFGHRFRYLPPVSNTFYALDKVKVGDRMTVAWSSKAYVYEVTDMRVIAPEDLSSVRQTEEPTLTLITCAPLFSTSQRLVVTAVLIQ